MKKYKITNGPTREEIIDGIFDGCDVLHRKRITFFVMDEEKESDGMLCMTINGIARCGTTEDNLIIDGYFHAENKEYFQVSGEYSMDTKKGWLKF